MQQWRKDKNKVTQKSKRYALWKLLRRTCYSGRLHATKPNQVTQVHTGKEAVWKYLSAMALALLVPLFGKPLITSACIEELLGLALQQAICYSWRCNIFCIKERFFPLLLEKNIFTKILKRLTVKSKAPQTLTTVSILYAKKLKGFGKSFKRPPAKELSENSTITFSFNRTW